MDELDIKIAGDQKNFLPGEEIELELSWYLEKPADRMELRFVWNTVGKGDTDIGIAKVVPFDMPSQSHRTVTRVTLPVAPYTFSGQLISLMWGVELVSIPSSQSTRRPLVIAPEGREVMIQKTPDGIEESASGDW